MENQSAESVKCKSLKKLTPWKVEHGLELMY